MDIQPCSFRHIDFAALEHQSMSGETSAAAIFQQADAAGIRMRVVVYEPGFVADHWCDLGHFGYVLSGHVTIEFIGRPPSELKEGQAFLVSSYGDASHRVRTEEGARLLLLD